MKMDILKNERAGLKPVPTNLPDSPGVYLMKDASSEILYIGKASSLKDRVSSIFRSGANLSAKTTAMLEHIEDIEWIVTGSDLEALILENNLIKSTDPNIMLSCGMIKLSYLRLSIDEDFPRLSIVRRYKKIKPFFSALMSPRML